MKIEINKLRVSAVRLSKNQRSRSKSSSSLSSYFCTRGISVNLQNGSWCVHIFRSFPASMVLCCVTHLLFYQKNLNKIRGCT
ncbi:hypothetical protein HanIR_Chr06g0261281 [Helianthus annuus]|nr:hypothetical protein HanIR_Chr06g0261281 [Helianthus annuus]